MTGASGSPSVPSSTQAARSTRMPAVPRSAAALSRSRVLPIPDGPVTSTARGSPPRASRAAPSTASSTARRPTNAVTPRSVLRRLVPDLRDRKSVV